MAGDVNSGDGAWLAAKVIMVDSSSPAAVTLGLGDHTTFASKPMR